MIAVEPPAFLQHRTLQLDQVRLEPLPGFVAALTPFLGGVTSVTGVTVALVKDSRVTPAVTSACFGVTGGVTRRLALAKAVTLVTPVTPKRMGHGFSLLGAIQ
jgi:hypothetical protein